MNVKGTIEMGPIDVKKALLFWLKHNGLAVQEAALEFWIEGANGPVDGVYGVVRVRMEGDAVNGWKEAK